jgi:hypothetical protein
MHTDDLPLGHGSLRGLQLKAEGLTWLKAEGLPRHHLKAEGLTYASPGHRPICANLRISLA